ncbi:MAG: hypothetical protein IIA87_03120 [Nanoarchaeota archaeon]|nr:hypothetical protein [Nanoarchaeota archaeon]
MGKRGQISVEYLIVVGFVTFLIVGILGVAFFYASGIRDEIKINQLNNFANKIISSSESVFYAGSPSKVTINAYLPAGVKVIEITSSELIFDIEISSGLNRISFSSNVPLDDTQGSSLSVSEGLKRIEIAAQLDRVSFREV